MLKEMRDKKEVSRQRVLLQNCNHSGLHLQWKQWVFHNDIYMPKKSNLVQHSKKYGTEVETAKWMERMGCQISGIMISASSSALQYRWASGKHFSEQLVLLLHYSGSLATQCERTRTYWAGQKCNSISVLQCKKWGNDVPDNVHPEMTHFWISLFIWLKSPGEKWKHENIISKSFTDVKR
jgi:hypothetical protein